MTEPQRLPDWEAFYRDYRKPGYITGFEITTKLGGGMFGLVFRARRMSIGKDYAIKFLQVDDGEVRKAVLAELEQVKYFAQIDHPNLVSIEDRGEVDGIPYLVMAFAGTETLRDKIVAGEVPTGAAKDELLRWFLQCCRGLAALHERSLVHFDIKPANVFLKGPVARLGDYGLSKLVTHSRGSLSMGRGTPYYMAPEMLQRRGDHRSDVYSLGVMLYELLCGVVPFTGDSEWEVLKKHETARPELPSHLSAREVAVLQRCLQKDPAARFQNVHDLIAALGGGVSTGAIAERAATPSAPVVPARLAATVLPDCVVPPLPASRVPTPPPLPALAGRAATRRERPARRSAVLPALLLTGLGVVLFLSYFLPTSRSPRLRQLAVTAVEAPPTHPVDAMARRSGVAADPLRRVGQEVDQLVQGVLRNARTAAQRERRQQLRAFDPQRFAAPDDQDQCKERVDKLAKVVPFAKGQAAKLAQLGRPMLLAAVESLQQLDYDEDRDRRSATNLHRLLAQMTTIDDLVVDVDSDAVGEGDICRFHVVADGWRLLAERFAASDAAFAQLLAAKGLVPGERSVSDGWSLADFVLVHAAALERPQLPAAAVHALGVGKVAATLSLTRLLQSSSRPRAVLLCGIAGAYPARHRRTAPPLGLAAVGIVGSDVLADEGVATPQGFRDLGRAESGPALVDVGPFLAAPELVQFAAKRLAVPIVRGATVSTCSGIDALSAARHEHTGADIETMEGAAVAAVCHQFGVPMLQLRAISNWTGDRDRGGWDLAAAMAALQVALRRLFGSG